MEIDLSEFRRIQDTRCVIGRAYDVLSDEDKVKLTAAFATRDITNVGISEWLAKRGINTTYTSVGTHRKKQCRCD